MRNLAKACCLAGIWLLLSPPGLSRSQTPSDVPLSSLADLKLKIVSATVLTRPLVVGDALPFIVEGHHIDPVPRIGASRNEQLVIVKMSGAVADPCTIVWEPTLFAASLVRRQAGRLDSTSRRSSATRLYAEGDRAPKTWAGRPNNQGSVLSGSSTCSREFRNPTRVSCEAAFLLPRWVREFEVSCAQSGDSVSIGKAILPKLLSGAAGTR